ncbi:MAG: DUF1365 domain-containing protein [Pseudomonadales bacterium]|nr:DUF1365 domain-containing protein [Pseudomonadales bacterium]
MAKQTSRPLESAIYKGVVRHRRFSPTQHEFEYPLFMFLLKADEISTVLSRFWQLSTSKLSLARFQRSDYIGNELESVETSVIRKIAELSGRPEQEIEGDVFMLVHLRYFGFYFSPLNVYYLRHDGEFRYMLAEVSNTPWNERHYYLQDLGSLTEQEKQFHVSPFNPMSQKYRWKILPPEAEHGSCSIHLQCHDLEDQDHRKVFDATMQLKRTELNQAQIRSVLLKTPIQTLSVVIGIYWQALKLFIKGTPLYKHPRKLEKEIVEKSGEKTA